MAHAEYLTPAQLSHALDLRDLTDPAQGGHAIQALLDATVSQLVRRWDSTVRYVRKSPPLSKTIQVATWWTAAISVGGRQIDVCHEGAWLELAECGRIHPEVLRGSGLDPAHWSGLALGMGLDRALMLRKTVPDIRYLRASDPRVATQMLTLEPWRHVSPLPPARRDISVVVSSDEDAETLGDRIRIALGDDTDVIESVELLSRTTHEELPRNARSRLGTRPGQVNLLLRIILRPIDRTLTADEANEIRNTIYRTIHEGPVMELI